MTEGPIRTVRYSYLPQQFADADEIFEQLKRFVPTGDFTLGEPVAEFERRFARVIGVRHAIGVGSGTDAIKLGLRAVGVGHGDEVITAANTFIATVGAIAETGARNVLIDVDDSFCMDAGLIEAAITEKTRAIVPVTLTGNLPDMPRIMEIADRYGLAVVEDACQGILANMAGRNAGAWGAAGAFSLHPLKNLNVWGDAGVVVTNDDETDRKLRLLRNHGLRNRDQVEILGYNSRLDSIQAIVGNWLVGDSEKITRARIENAAYYDERLGAIDGITLPQRRPGVRHVYHLYMVFAERRDGLFEHCLANGVEAKIHYPIPLYQQEGLRHLGYAAGDFPVTDRHAGAIISFPADQHLHRAELDYVIDTVRGYYESVRHD